jgi:hypothetical protein
MFALAITLVTLVCSPVSAAERPSTDSATQNVDVWTESDWVIWWDYVQLRMDQGASNQEIYWLIHDQMEALSAVDPRFSFSYPPPYSGWTDDGPIYVEPYSVPGKRFKGEQGPGSADFGLQNFVCGADSNYPFSTCPRVPDLLEPPPTRVAAGLAWLGSMLTRTSHPASRAVGAAMVEVAAAMFFFIETLEDEDEENEGE